MSSQTSVQGTPAAASFPGRQARTLPHRARLVGVHALHLALPGGRVHHAQRRAVEHGGQAARVAVREDARAAGQKRRAVRADGAVGGLVFRLHALDEIVERVGDLPGAHALGHERTRVARRLAHAPGQVDRRRAGGSNLLGHRGEPFQEVAGLFRAALRARARRADATRPQRHRGRPRHADGRRPAHGERLHRIHHAPPVPRAHEGQLAGKPALVHVGQFGGAVAGTHQLDGARQVFKAKQVIHETHPFFWRRHCIPPHRGTQPKGRVFCIRRISGRLLSVSAHGGSESFHVGHAENFPQPTPFRTRCAIGSQQAGNEPPTGALRFDGRACASGMVEDGAPDARPSAPKGPPWKTPFPDMQAGQARTRARPHATPLPRLHPQAGLPPLLAGTP